jgi:ribonucleoside-triphosphate reductase
MLRSGGSEPGMINAVAAIKRAPWFSGVNPCAEILLCDKGFCNLCEYDLGSASDLSYDQVLQEMRLLARANYRQTCVNLRDGILQDAWHQNNQFLRLCGVGLTGVFKSTLDGASLEYLRAWARAAAQEMALELNLPMPKNVTTIKPSGTMSKIMDTTEGMHSPLGAHVFNKVGFGNDDPLLGQLSAAGYDTMPNPYDPSSTLVTFPVFNGGPVYNTESAVKQLNRYKDLMVHWCDQNVSCTISYSPEELQEIEDWLVENWDYYVGVSFILRADPTKRAKDLGYAYLPQEVVTKEEYDAYVSRLRPVSYGTSHSTSDLESDCVGGACPIR